MSAFLCMACSKGIAPTPAPVAPSEPTPAVAPSEPAPAPPEPAPSSPIMTDVLVVGPELHVVPGERIGPLGPGASRADVEAAFGPVVEADIDVGEGMTAPGLTVFAEEPTKTAALLLEGDAVTELRLNRGATAWSVVGLHVADPLSAVVEANGGPLDLLGFGWDYAGTLVDYKDGELARYRPHLIVRVSPSPATAAVSDALIGDRLVPSDHPELVALAPTVYQIVVELPAPEAPTP